MSRLYQVALALLLTFSMIACDNNIDKSRNFSDVTILYGDVVTMNDNTPSAEAVAIKDNKIIAVGNKREIIDDYPGARLADFTGKTILPGFIDSHTHIVNMGLEKIKVDLSDTKTVAEMINRVKEYYPNPKPGQWLLGKGWDEAVWATIGYPDKMLLDEAFPDNPVHLEALHTFASLFNQKAFEAAEISDDIEDKNFLRREDGTLSGTVLDKAQEIVRDAIPKPTIQQLKTAILTSTDIMAKAGLTAVHEANVSRDSMTAFEQLAAEGKLPIRIYGMVDGVDPVLTREWLEMGPKIDKNNFYTVRSIKVFYDGSLGSRTALMQDGYSDDPEANNKIMTLDKVYFDQLVTDAAERGFQMIVHAIGDKANDEVVDSYAAILKNHPGYDHRYRIEHAQVVLPSFYQKAAQNNIIASMEPAHALDDSAWAKARVGPERIHNAYAWKNMLDNNVKLIFNSDLPAATWRIQDIMYYAVNRRKLDGGEPWYPDQAVSIKDALKAMTIDSAYAGFMDDTTGSIEAGKLADFTILDQNPVKIDPLRLNDINVVEVWVDGKKVEF
ncbi:MAG: amidohydrolase [Kordiimonadaceae bacterium]|nr:amidohydrolase [Kordiimonadaceae bacterium]